MISLLATLSDSLLSILLLSIATIFCVLFAMRTRFLHLFEPAIFQSIVTGAAFSAFWPLYSAANYTWQTLFVACILSVLPFLIFYRNRGIVGAGLAHERASFIDRHDFSALIYVCCSIVILNMLISAAATGGAVAAKSDIGDVRLAMGRLNVVGYFSQAATPLLPCLLYLTYGTRRFYVVVTAFISGIATGVILGSRVSLLQPILGVGAVLFWHALDVFDETGKRVPLFTIRNVIIGIGGMILAGMLVFLLGLLVSGSAGQFVYEFLLRFFLQFDGIFLVVNDALLSPHVRPEYSVALAYIQPITKMLHVDTGQVYSNVGEYIGVAVYHMNIWKNPELAKAALPNSNLALEFVLSFSRPIAWILIFLWSTSVMLALNFFEKRRYRGVGYFCMAQYLVMSPLGYFLDGNYFVIGLYGLGALWCLAKLLSLVIPEKNAQEPQYQS
jgi:hypothetical protein